MEGVGLTRNPITSVRNDNGISPCDCTSSSHQNGRLINWSELAVLLCLLKSPYDLLLSCKKKKPKKSKFKFITPNGSNGPCIMPPTAKLLKTNMKYSMVYAINLMTVKILCRNEAVNLREAVYLEFSLELKLHTKT